MKIDKHLTWVSLKDPAKKSFLFGRKLEGFGKGKLVGIGGKVEAGESVEDAAKREVCEEVGAEIQSMKKLGCVIFDNLLYQGKRERVMMHIFIAEEWTGEIRKSEELDPTWIASDKIPFAEFWEDSKYWMPYALVEEEVQGYFHFDQDNMIDDYWVEPVPNLEIDELRDSNFDLPEAENFDDFKPRYVVRAILLDKNNRVGIIKATNRGYYKLPGGGIDEGELIREALHREVREEAGYEIDVLEELGKTIEYRSKFKQTNISYGYVCRAKDFVGTELMKDEQEDGYELEWFDSIDDAIETIAAVDTSNMVYQAKFFTERELAFLAAARAIMANFGGTYEAQVEDGEEQE